MALRLYNSLARRKEEFRPLVKGEVRMYNCGPTVYHFAHIGNFRAYIFADLLRRLLEWKGLRVKQVMNITDVGHFTADQELEQGGEDKIELAARRERRSPKQIADFYTMAFFEDIGKLNLKKAWLYPRATDHIPQMQEIIARLLEKGLAYERAGNVYFEISRFPGYGKLSGNTLRKLQAGKRIRVNPEKKSPLDFALWIRNPRHLMQWDSPWGPGYPGWHIECSAMGMAYLGETLDIHTGGEDNIFPHHECEIAQSQGATGKPFSRFWLHARHLLVNGRKMSKSLGNFFTLRDLLERGYSPRSIRFLLLSAHYRTRPNFTERGLKAAEEAVRGLDRFIAELRAVRKGGENGAVRKLIGVTRERFGQALDDDLNISVALAALFDFVREVNRRLPGRVGKETAKECVQLLLDLDHVLGLDLGREVEIPREIEEDVQKLVLERERLRRRGAWKEADLIRERIRGMGYAVEDTESGPRVRKR